eukprot:UN17159
MKIYPDLTLKVTHQKKNFVTFFVGKKSTGSPDVGNISKVAWKKSFSTFTCTHQCYHV